MQNNSSPKENPAGSCLESTTNDDTAEVNFDQRFAMLRSIGECTNEDDLRALLKKKNAPVCYVWCDPSPSMHITQGITMAINVNKLLEAGCKVKIFMADWFTLTDHNVSLRKVRDVCSYTTEMWRTAGMRLDEVELVRASDEISRDAHRYWPLAMKVARRTRLSEMTECILSSKDTRLYGSMDPYEVRALRSDKVFNTCLQSAAILARDEADVWLLDIGQRAGNMVAGRYRELPTARREDRHRPVALFHGVLPSLLEYPEIEMFGDPRWAIYMEDTEWEVGRAMRKAFCPPGTAEGNPCLEYIRQIVFPLFGRFEVVRNEEDGGDRTFLSMEELAADYESGALQAADVKRALEKAINAAWQPVRDHFGFASIRPLNCRAISPSASPAAGP